MVDAEVDAAEIGAPGAARGDVPRRRFVRRGRARSSTTSAAGSTFQSRPGLARASRAPAVAGEGPGTGRDAHHRMTCHPAEHSDAVPAWFRTGGIPFRWRVRSDAHRRAPRGRRRPQGSRRQRPARGAHGFGDGSAPRTRLTREPRRTQPRTAAASARGADAPLRSQHVGGRSGEQRVERDLVPRSSSTARHPREGPIATSQTEQQAADEPELRKLLTK